MYFTKSAYTVALLIVGVGLAVNGYSQSFLTNGLIAYFPFNGNANDASGNGNSGILSGASFTLDRFGVTNSALRIPNGATMSASLPNYVITHTNAITISVWVKLISFSGQYGYIAGVGGGQCGDFGIGFGLDNIHLKTTVAIDCTTYPNYVEIIMLQSADTNEWHNLLETCSNGNLIFYLDGVQVGRTNIVPNISYSLLPNSLVIGNREEAPINASVDDIRIYNRALSPNEVAQLYAIESGPRVDLIKAVKPSFSNLTLTTNYQMQISGDLNTWTNYGAAFTATNTTMVYPQYFDVLNWNSLYFRVKTTP